MPIYEYACSDCGEKFDILRPMKDADSPISCRKCESLKTNRLISVFYAQSGGRVVAGNGNVNHGCSSCSSSSCSTCRAQ